MNNDINFIHGDIHGRSCKKIYQLMQHINKFIIFIL